MSTTLSDIVSRRPTIRCISIPEVKKRKEPNKYYVYKILVEWSNGTKTVVYRRYSAFFDFNIKLQELYSNLHERNPSFEAHLPELPGKILFGRSQIHQVAEKRRGKIEEYCLQLLTLPVELSSSGLVLGFFSTWQDDALFPSEQSSSAPGDRPPSPLSAATFNLSSVAPTGTLAAGSIFSPSAVSTLLPAFPIVGPSPPETLISHPEEMENLEQYRVIANYERKDSHQVTLHAGQIVHVIEKHDTGWWMVMAEDEQGYAPAAHLEPLEGSNQYDHLPTEDAGLSPVYEALENYTPQSDDEVGFKAGDKVEVLAKSMDGWWRIRVNNKEGLSPSTLIIQKRVASPPVKSDTLDPLYETGGIIYEGLHVHRPPPRRNTITKKGDIDIYGSLPEDIYALPRTENVWIKTAGDDNVSDVPNGAQYYKVPRSTPALVEEVPKTNHTAGGGMASVSEAERFQEEEEEIQEETTAHKGQAPGGSSPSRTKEQHGAGGSRGGVASDGRPPPNPTPASSSSQGKVEVDEYVFMADQDDKDGNGEINVVAQAAGITATLPVSSSPRVVSRHPLNPAPSSQVTTRLRSLSEDRLLSGSSKSSLQAPPLCPPQPASQVPPAVPDEYVDMSGDGDDPTYAVPPDALLPEGDPHSLSSLSRVQSGPSVHAPQELATPTTASMQKAPQSQTRSQPPSSSSRTSSVSQQGVPSQRPTGSTGSSPPGARKETVQTPPIKAPKPTNKIKVGDAVVEVESKSDLHNELRQKFSQKSKSTGEIDVGQDTNDSTKVKPIIKKKIPSSPSHKALEHTISSPIPSSGEGGTPRAFIAQCDYSSQTEGCLSFSKGDRCVLVKNTPGGWWLVTINGKEGWTPSDYWDEETKVQHGRPLPSIPPQPADKKSKDGKGAVTATAQGTAAEPQCSTTPILAAGTNSPAVVPSDGDRQLSDSTELKKVGPSVSGTKAKPLVPAPFKKITSEKPAVLSKPTKSLSNVSQGIPASQPVRSSEINSLPVRKNGELPPGGAAIPNDDVLAGGQNGEALDGGPGEVVAESEYSMLTDVMGEAFDFRNAPWFVGKMEREKAEQVLKEYGRQREFLVRERVGKDGYFAISIRHHYSFKHFNIDPTNDGKYSMGPLVFSSLEEIVAHYQNNSLFIHDGQHVTLGQPVKLKNRGEKPL